MIRKISICGFKKFAKQEFEIPGHLIVAGPNNSGKTSLLQAVAAWTEIALRWSQRNPDLVRESDGNYAATNITVDSFASVPLADFDHLWADQKTGTPLAVRLESDRWNIGFEALRRERELIAVRPTRDVQESDLDVLKDDLDDSHEQSGRSWRPVYIPPVSGVQVQERQFAREEAIFGHLARGEAGRVLRNLLWRARQNGHWDDLNNVIKSFFGYELMTFKPDGEYLVAPFRHSSKEAASCEEMASYDLSCAASGFLQVFLIYVAIFGRPSAVYLIDEPDAHLHISLQNMLFRDLLKRAEQDGFQVIIATHSEYLIREARGSGLRLLDANGDLREVPDRDKVLDALALDQVEVMEVLRKQCLLYLEGSTDIKMLIAWAETLDHRCLPFLQRVTPIETAQGRLRKDKAKEHFPAAHFTAMRLLIPEVRGVELLDGDKRDGDRKTPDGLELLFWSRKEIESYLLHPDSVVRYLRSKTSQESTAKAHRYMEENLPPKFFENPFEESPVLEQLEIKKFFSALFQEAGMPLPSHEDFLGMAEQMAVEEIPPEVCEKLNLIAEHLGLSREMSETG